MSSSCYEMNQKDSMFYKQFDMQSNYLGRWYLIQLNSRSPGWIFSKMSRDEKDNPQIESPPTP